MLATGHNETSFVKFITDQKVISRRQSQQIVAKCYELFIEDLSEMDIGWKEMFS